jgi:hypothetical protein
VTPYKSLLKRAKDLSWHLPGKAIHHLQHLLPDMKIHSRKAATSHPLNEIVFATPLTVTGGLELFCDALTSISDTLYDANIKITFVSTEDEIFSMPGTEYIELRAAEWEFEWSFLDRMDTKTLFSYLSTEGRAVILPQLAEGQRVFADSLLNYNIPFFASQVSDIKDMFASKEGEDFMFKFNNSESLAHTLKAASLSKKGTCRLILCKT